MAHWWINVPVAKNTQNIFQNLGLYVFRGLERRLVRGWRFQSQGVHRDFHGLPRDSLTGRTSSREKHLDKFFKICVLSVWVTDLGDLLATWHNRENRVFCENMAVFKTFLVFPQSFVTIHCLPRFTTLPNSSCLSQKLHFSSTSQHQSSRKRYGFFSFHYIFHVYDFVLLDLWRVFAV